MNRFRWKLISILSALSVIVFVLSGCGPQQASPSSQEQDTSGSEAQTTEEASSDDQLAETGGRRTLVVSGWGGLWEQTVTEQVYAPFEEKFNVDVVHTLNAGFAEALAKQRAELGNPTIDVFLTGGGFERIAVDEGLLEPFDYEKMPNLKDVYEGGIYKDSIVANSVAGVGLVYHKDRVPRPPTSWYDLWDPAFQPVAISDMSDTYGRALFTGINNLEGGTVDNAAPGWEKFAQLMTEKSPIINLTTDDTTNAIVARGAALSVAPNSRAIQLIKEGLPIGFVYPEEGGFAWGTYMGISKDTPNKDLAMEFINFWLDPQIQANWAVEVNYGPANVKAEIPADYGYTDLLVYHNTLENAYFLNWDEINQQLTDWNQQWTTQILPLLNQ